MSYDWRVMALELPLAFSFGQFFGFSRNPHPSFLRSVDGRVFVRKRWLFLLTVTLALLSSSEDTIATSWSLRPILSSVPCAYFLSETPPFPAAAATRDALRA